MLFSSSMMISSVELTSKASKQLKHNPRTIKNGRMCQGNSNDFMQNQMPFTTKNVDNFLTTSGSSNWCPSICPTQDIPGFLLRRLAHLGTVITWPGHIFWPVNLPEASHGSVVKFHPVKRSALILKEVQKMSPAFFFGGRTKRHRWSAIPSTWWWRAFARYHPWASVSDWSRDCYLNAHLSALGSFVKRFRRLQFGSWRSRG